MFAAHVPPPIALLAPAPHGSRAFPRTSMRRSTARPPSGFSRANSTCSRCARQARISAALESRSEDGPRGAADVRQVARLPRRATRRRHQVSLGAGRHAELVTLAQAWHLTGDSRYSAGCRTLLDSWFEQCPYPLGPHWTSSLEHGVRLLNWSFAWHLLGGDDSALFESSEGRAFRERWLASIYQHCHFIAGHLSRYSSANNHLLGELDRAVRRIADLAAVARMRGLARNGPSANSKRRRSLQNGPDGVNREQAIWYHHEVADMMLVAGLVARANGCDFAPEYWRRLEAMLDFIASIMDVGGNVPAFGDADDAVIARLDPDADADVYRSLLATGAVLFARPNSSSRRAASTTRAAGCSATSAAEQFAALNSADAAQLPVRREFAEAGYYVLGTASRPRESCASSSDAGPLGLSVHRRARPCGRAVVHAERGRRRNC